MGSKCDFYAGRGPQAQYLGSIGHDALAVGLADYFAGVTDRAAFDASLADVFGQYGEIPANTGWPWPWNDSHVTGLAVSFDAGDVWVSHPNGCWARLADCDTPTEVRCEYPDLGAQAQATPEGRLRWCLRHRGLWTAPLEQDLLLALLAHVANLLAKRFLHVFEQEGAFYVPACFWADYERSAVQLHMLVDALHGSEEFAGLLAERKAVRAEREWDLLSWLVDTKARFPGEDCEQVLTTTLPVYFGQPLGAKALASFGHPLRYCRLGNPATLREGLALLEAVLDHMASHYAVLLANEILDFGCLPVPLPQAQDWLEAAQPVLGGQSLHTVCATADGRQRARCFAAQLVSGDVAIQRDACR